MDCWRIGQFSWVLALLIRNVWDMKPFRVSLMVTFTAPAHPIGSHIIRFGWRCMYLPNLLWRPVGPSCHGKLRRFGPDDAQTLGSDVCTLGAMQLASCKLGDMVYIYFEIGQASILIISFTIIKAVSRWNTGCRCAGPKAKT